MQVSRRSRMTQPRTTWGAGVRTRIAPSPTGEDLHVGNAYTALLNYAFARKNKGQFIVRIEDTDQKRKVKGAEERILASLKWLSLEPDEGLGKEGSYSPYRQSERLKLYQKYAKQLVEQGDAYYCFCTPERLAKIRKKQQKTGKPPIYDGYCRQLKAQPRTRTFGSVRGKGSGLKADKGEPYVIRLKMPREGETVFTDVLRGEVKFQNKLIDDQVLLKSDGFPTYHLAVVVDDHLMEITHIIRGDEWISSVPKHIKIYKSFGWNLPIFAHTPILRNADKSKLSKRKNPVWVGWYREQGFLPEALINYLGLLGYSMPDGREEFTLGEFIDEFELDKIATSGPIFDTNKLEWLNGEYIRKLKVKSLKSKVIEYIGGEYEEEIVEKTIPLIQTRIRKLSDYLPLCNFFFQPPKEYEKEVNRDWIKKVITILTSVTTWKTNFLYEKVCNLAQKLSVSKSKLFMDIRIGITGRKVGPPLFESMEILGKQESLRRLAAAL